MTGLCNRRVVTALLSLSWLTLLAGPQLHADVRLPSVFGNHMVLQQGQVNPVWGTADPNEQVTVHIGDQVHETTADEQGKWKLKIESLPVGGPYTLSVNGKNRIRLEDVLVGEVWICSGQSNMQWSVDQADDPDLEKLTANLPRIRLISVPHVARQEPQDDFQGQWAVCSPETVGDFSAVGYFFGRQLHQTLDVPIGLIDNSWGGSACEAWIRRDLLEADDRYQPLLNRWAEIVREWDTPAKKGVRRRIHHRPANLYNGVLHPVIGYGIRGTIWYQGESNAGRAHQYRHLFPLMIQNWRDAWGQGDFSFYWVQLADFRTEEVGDPGDSDWAELREAQTKALKLPNTGEAVITDLGEAEDIHPKNKQDVAKRLARWALARDYGLDIIHASPRYKSMKILDDKIVITFDVGGREDGALDTFDVKEVRGFSIADTDQVFVRAQAKIVGPDKIEVTSDELNNELAAVRYAWADNPACNLQNKAGLPVTPFRTDDWPGITDKVVAP